MKATILCFIGLTLILFSSIAFSSCGSSSGCDSKQAAYESSASVCSSCQCVDRNWRLNDCISRNEYCEAFGNIGAR